MPAGARHKRLRLGVFGSIAAVAALIAAVLVPIAASATTVQLSGAVTGPNGKALAGVGVNAVSIGLGGGMTTVGTVFTSTSGSYSFSGLPAGPTYTLRFGATSTTFQQYLGETSDPAQADTFALVAAGSFHSTINATLLPSGSISGYVKSITHAALKGYTVRAFADGDVQDLVRSAVTGTTGAYTITGLEPGLYQLEALYTGSNPPYGPVYSGNTATLDAATPVQAIASKTASYSFTMGKAGAISGKVTGQAVSGTIPLGGVTVTPLLLKGTSPGFTGATTVGMNSTVTKADGTYSLTGLMPGYYTLQFTPGGSTPLSPTSDPYGSSFLDDSSGIATEATNVHVVGGATVSNTNEELIEQASVTVNVTDSVSSDPIANIQVTIDHYGAPADQPGDGSQTSFTDGSGAVTFHGLGEGRYEVIVGSNDPNSSSLETYQREIVEFQHQLVSGTTDVENVTATLKASGGLQPTAPITISCCGGGPWKVGEFVGVNPDGITWNDEYVDPSKDTVQWYRNGVAIAGATSTQYLLGANDVGAVIDAKVTAYDLAYGSGTGTSETPGVIGAGSLYTDDGNGGIFGLEEFTSTLNYVRPHWTVPNVQETDVWQTSTDNGSTWNPLAVQPTNDKYSPTLSDIGNLLRVEVTGQLPGYSPTTFDSAAVPVYDGNYTLKAAPKLTTTSTTWSVSSGTWSPNYGPTSYLWTVIDTHGNQTQYTTTSIPRAGKVGYHVDVEVFRDPTGMNALFAPRINVQTGVALVPSGTATITGTPQFSSTLTLTIPTFTPTSTATNCQWQYKYSSTVWKSIGGATSCTSYVPVASDIGHILRVAITATHSGFASHTIYATETSAVTALPLNNTVAPQIFGTVGTGTDVIAGTGSWSYSPSAYAYHWKYSANGLAPFTTAPGTSNAATYFVPQSLLGKVLLVDVTASLSGHTTTTATKSAGTVAKYLLTAVANPHVSVSGTTLTASGSTFSPSGASIAYNWYAYSTNGVSLSEIAGPITTPVNVSAYPHQLILVQAVANLSGYSQTDGPAVLARNGDLVASGSLALSGSTAYTAISSSGINWNIGSAAVAYQWQYKNGTTWVSIKGATMSSFVPSSAYVGKQLRLLETASAAHYNSATVISTTQPVVQAAASPTPGVGGNAPAITGTNQVGSTLTANPGVWSVAGTTYSYQWQTSPNDSTWTNVAGATSSHFVVPLAAFTTPLYVGVVITASKSGYVPGHTLVAESSTSAEGPVTLATAPKVTAVAAKYTVSTGSWSHATSYTYDWFTMTPTGGENDNLSSTNTYTAVPGDAGNAIFVRVTASGPNYLDNNTTVLARSGGPITISSAMKLDGYQEEGPNGDILAPAEGSMLSPVIGSWSVNSPTVTWQWYRAGKAIAGATNPDYTPVAADVAHSLSLTATVAELGWTTEKFSVSAGVVWSNADIYYAGKPTITGSPTVDSVLSVTTAAWTESGVTTTYQWERGGQDIPGATGTTYTVTAADLGWDIYVNEFGSKPYRPTRNAYAGPVTIGQGATLAITTTPLKISGTVQLGKTLTATSGPWNYAVTLTYQWQYEAPLSATWNDISGATASTYVPNATDGDAVGGSLRVIETASRAGHLTQSATSPAIVISP